MSVAPEIVRALHDGAKLLSKSGLEPSLRVLIELRASQLNRCAFCLALHMREGQALKESSDRLNGLAAWREAPWYSGRERAALEWTEALTQLSDGYPDGELLARMRQQFNDREIVYLTLAINNINSWNRLNVAFGTSPERADAVFQMLHSEASPVRA
jgi:AhpD family alkylhydroperoxidase